MSRFNANQIKLLAVFFTETKKLTLRETCEQSGTAKTTFKKNKAVRFILPDLQT